jgi:hypothetical protein
MSFLQLANSILIQKRITFQQSQQLNQLLWSKDFTPEELAVLNYLTKMLDSGIIKVC